MATVDAPGSRFDVVADHHPVWVDVRFDHAASGAAADEFRRAARRLDDATETRRALIDSIGDRWSGPRRDAWLDATVRLMAADRRLARALRSDARVIEAASDAAHREQARREAERAEWIRVRAAAASAAELAAPWSDRVGAQAPIAW